MSTTSIDWSAQEVKDTDAIVADGKPLPPRRMPGFGGPPRKGTAPKSATRQSKPKTVEPPSKPGEFTEDIAGFYTMLGLGVGMRDQFCGRTIVENAEKIATEWDKLAESNPAVRKALRSMLKVTAVGSLMAAHVPIIMAISAHHGPGFGPKPDVETETEETE